MPLAELVGERGRRRGQDRRRRNGGRRRSSSSRWSSAARAADSSSSSSTSRSARTRSGGPDRPTCRLGRTDLAEMIDVTSSAPCGRDEDHVGARRRPARRRAGTWASTTTRGWPCGGRGVIDGTTHREVLALEVDVVELVPVDEAPGGAVTDLGVVLPAVPQPSGHLDRIGGLGRTRVLDRRRSARGSRSRRPKWATSSLLR